MEIITTILVIIVIFTIIKYSVAAFRKDRINKWLDDENVYHSLVRERMEKVFQQNIILCNSEIIKLGKTLSNKNSQDKIKFYSEAKENLNKIRVKFYKNNSDVWESKFTVDGEEQLDEQQLSEELVNIFSNAYL